jgi:predicted GNAT superfamily acetyltransferase
MSASQASYNLRDLRTFAEALEVHRIQQAIWGFDDPAVGPYPPLLLVAAQNGGTVLGAFDPQDHMIGYDIQALKLADLALALDWRLRVRESFETYFKRGYAAVDFRIVREGETWRQGYVLSRTIGHEHGLCSGRVVAL